MSGDLGRGPLRARSRAVWAVVALGGLLLATAGPTWLSTTVSTALADVVPVEVTGTSATPAVGAAGLVVVAGGLALAIAGRVARWVALVVVALAGLLSSVSAVGILADPVPAATTGASAVAGVTDLTSPVSLTAWPWLTAALGGLVAVVAVLAALGAPAWGTTSGRHERAGAASPAGDGAPTAAAVGPAAGAGPDAGPDAGPGDGVPGAAGGEPGHAHDAHDPHDAWDALSQGTDPSADR